MEEVVGRDEPDPPRSSRPKDATIREQSNLCPERKINNEIQCGVNENIFIEMKWEMLLEESLPESKNIIKD